MKNTRTIRRKLHRGPSLRDYWAAVALPSWGRLRGTCTSTTDSQRQEQTTERNLNTSRKKRRERELAEPGTRAHVMWKTQDEESGKTSEKGEKGLTSAPPRKAP